MEPNIVALMVRDSFRPHRLMKSTAGLLWETISFPWVDPDTDRVLVNVRIPGDPTTMITVDVFDMTPEGAACLCDNTVRPQFYFVDTPADAVRRSADVDHLTRNATRRRQDGGR